MLNGKKYIKELFGDARPAQRMLDNVNSGQEESLDEDEMKEDMI